MVSQYISILCGDKLYNETDVRNHLRELLKLQDDKRLTWIIIKDPQDKQEYYSNSLLVTKIAIETGFLLRNYIVYPQLDLCDSTKPITNITYTLLMLAKSKEYFFNKDPIREKHIWKDKEWGKGKRKSGKTVYNPKGKDPGNFWILTSKNKNFTDTKFKVYDRGQIVNRILSSSGIAKDNVVLYYDNDNEMLNFEDHITSLRKSVRYVKIQLEYVTPPERVSPSKIKLSRNLNKLKNTIYYKSSNSMEEIPDNSISLAITSPPYWGLRNYGHEDEFGREKNYDGYLENMKAVWQEIYRVLLPGGTFWLNINSRMKNGNTIPIPSDFYLQCRKIGFKCLSVIYWHKRASVAGLTPNNLVDKIEYILVFYKETFPTINQTNFGSIDLNLQQDTEINCWIMDQIVGSLSKDIDKMIRGKKDIPDVGKLEYPHTALYPLDFVQRAITIASKEEDIVLDPFIGTGTTAQAAYMTNRKFVGYEINPEYKKIIDYRLEMTKEQILENTKQQNIDKFFSQ